MLMSGAMEGISLQHVSCCTVVCTLRADLDRDQDRFATERAAELGKVSELLRLIADAREEHVQEVASLRDDRDSLAAKLAEQHRDSAELRGILAAERERRVEKATALQTELGRLATKLEEQCKDLAHLRMGEVPSLRADLDRDLTRSAIEHAAELGKVAELRRLIADGREERVQEVASWRDDRDSPAAKFAEQHRDPAEFHGMLAAEREQHVEKATSLQTDLDRLATKPDEGFAQLRGRLAGSIGMPEQQRDSLQGQLASAPIFTLPLRQVEVPAAGGRNAEKHIEIAAPGIAEDRIVIESLTNSVAVRIRTRLMPEGS